MKIWLDRSESIRLVEESQRSDKDLEISLVPGQLLVLDGNQRTKRFQSLEGRVWITVEGELRDILLAPGDKVEVDRAGKIIANALQPGKMRISLR